jgi:hypothetical protein
MAGKAQDLEDLLDELSETAKTSGKKITAGEIYEAVDARTFGPLLLTAGLLGLTPISTVPTAPTTLAVVVALTAGQMVLGRKTLWLPRWILRLSVDADKLQVAVEVARKPARAVDRLLRPRLQVLTSGVAARVAALACLIVAFITPPLELVPFATFLPASVISVFGLGLVARDGLLVLVAICGTAAALGSVVWVLVR